MDQSDPPFVHTIPVSLAPFRITRLRCSVGHIRLANRQSFGPAVYLTRLHPVKIRVYPFGYFPALVRLESSRPKPYYCPGPLFIPTFVGEVIRTVLALGWKLARPGWVECHVSTEAGPNAQATVGSVEDAHLFSGTHMFNIETLRGKSGSRCDCKRPSLQPPSLASEIQVGAEMAPARLSLVRDKEAKVRIVATLDY